MGPVLVVGAGNSGAEIALELARRRRVWLAGRNTGHVPAGVDARIYRLATAVGTRNPVVRRVTRVLAGHGTPLVGVRERDLVHAGIERVPKLVGVRDGAPLLADGRTLGVVTVVWCTGFRPDFGWIALPGYDAHGVPGHRRGVVLGEPGLYVVGQPFQTVLSSGLVGGAGADAEVVARAISARS